MLRRVRAWLANRGLQWRIQLAAIVGLLIIVPFFWLAGQRTVTTCNQQIVENQLALAHSIAVSLDRRLDTVLTLLETTAAHKSLRALEPTPASRSLLQDTQRQLRPYGRRLFWLDLEGNVLWMEPFDPGRAAQPYPNMAAIRASLHNQGHYISSLKRSPERPQPSIILAAPVLEPTGDVGALLVEELRADWIETVGPASCYPSGESVQIEIIDQAGMVLDSSLPESRFHQVDQAGRFAPLLEGRQPLVGRCHQCHAGDGPGELYHTEATLAFAPLSMASWGVALRQPVAETTAPLNRLRWQIAIGGGAILTITLLITWLVTRQILSPIQALDRASAQLANGKLDVPMPRGGVDEIARLTANLERMRIRLDQTLADQRRWNETLEDMVEERTHELTTLYEQLQAKESVCKRLLGKVLTTQEEERARLARELHDAIGQSLTAIIMTAMSLESGLPPSAVGEKGKLSHVRAIAAQALQDLRNLIFDLRPEILDDLGLALALRSQTKKHLEPAGVQVQLRAAGLKDQLPPEVERAVFRVVQEAITNIARHAEASRATISLTRKDNRLLVRVEDNGIGFNPDRVKETQAWGLQGMEERITLLGGEFYIGSKSGSGTLVLAEIPLDQPEQAGDRDVTID